MKKLNPIVWNFENKLIPDIKNKLIMIAKKVAEDVATKVKIKNIYLTGSLATYKWTPSSDFDLHIIVDVLENYSDNTMSEYLDLRCKIFNLEHSIFIKGYKVEVNMKEKEVFLKDKAVYDLLKDEWVVLPNPKTRDLNDPDVLNLTRMYQNKIDSLIDSNGSIEDVDLLKKEIKNLRVNGLQEEGEYSVGNLTFKKLRNTEYVGKLFSYKKELVNKKYSLESFKSLFVNVS
jgi:predicted nucleotidyltransferase